MKVLGIVAVILFLLLAVTVSNRHWLMLQLVGFVDVPLLIDKQEEGPDVSWHDDYYTLEWLDSRTVAIGEPLYYQQNINYLIIGDERAVLFLSRPDCHGNGEEKAGHDISHHAGHNPCRAGGGASARPCGRGFA